MLLVHWECHGIISAAAAGQVNIFTKKKEMHHEIISNKQNFIDFGLTQWNHLENFFKHVNMFTKNWEGGKILEEE